MSNKPPLFRYELLTAPASQTKMAKALEVGWYTPVLHLAPHRLSGYQVCPRADGCEATCLYYSGKGAFPTVVTARLRRTWQFFEDRPQFMAALWRDLRQAQLDAERLKLRLAVRLNGTSDIPWEKIRLPTGQYLPEALPEVQFYDYTKIFGRRTPANYHLTFSESRGNQEECRAWLEQGGTVASVFHNTLPKRHLGAKVIDGDQHDLRFLDIGPVVAGLRFKHPNGNRALHRAA